MMTPRALAKLAVAIACACAVAGAASVRLAVASRAVTGTGLGAVSAGSYTGPINVFVVAEGDSITAGYIYGASAMYPEQGVTQAGFTTAAPGFVPSTDLVNLALSGESVVQRAANANPSYDGPATITAFNSSAATGKHLILSWFEGTNDLCGVANGNQTLATVEAAWGTYITYIRANAPRAVKVLCATAVDRDQTLCSSPAGYAAVRTAHTNWNAWLASQVGTTNCDAMADFASDPNLGCNLCADNTTYFTSGTSDQTHPTPLAHSSLMAPLWVPKVVALGRLFGP